MLKIMTLGSVKITQSCLNMKNDKKISRINIFQKYNLNNRKDKKPIEVKDYSRRIKTDSLIQIYLLNISCIDKLNIKIRDNLK